MSTTGTTVVAVAPTPAAVPAPAASVAPAAPAPAAPAPGATTGGMVTGGVVTGGRRSVGGIWGCPVGGCSPNPPPTPIVPRTTPVPGPAPAVAGWLFLATYSSYAART